MGSVTSILGLSILLVLALIPALLVGVLVWGTVRLIGGNGRKESLSADESKLIQEIHQGLQRMEHRVEALETLLMDQEKGGGS